MEATLAEKIQVLAALKPVLRLTDPLNVAVAEELGAAAFAEAVAESARAGYMAVAEVLDELTRSS